MRSSCSFNVLRLYVTAHFLAGKKSSNVDRWIPRDEMNGWMNARLTDPPPFSIPSSQRAAYHFLAPDANTRPYCRIYLTQIVSRHCTAYLRPIWRVLLQASHSLTWKISHFSIHTNTLQRMCKAFICICCLDCVATNPCLRACLLKSAEQEGAATARLHTHNTT